MRGAHQARYLYRQKRRIIPADAGSTRQAGLSRLLSKDHPRGCGEHIIIKHTLMNGRGSSPRMRGALFPPVSWPKAPRIIPADAGSTPGYLVELTVREDHPRGCGEHLSVPLPKQGVIVDHPRGCGEHSATDDPTHHEPGSSPRMRGALCALLGSVASPRIIPADAGSTVLVRSLNSGL